MYWELVTSQKFHDIDIIAVITQLRKPNSEILIILAKEEVKCSMETNNLSSNNNIILAPWHVCLI